MSNTILRYQGDGVETQFPYSFTNYNEKYNSLEGRVVDANNVVVEGTYTITFDDTISIATVTPAVPDTHYVELYILVKDEPVTVFDKSTKRVTENNMNDMMYQMLVSAQAVEDHRTNERIRPEDMNGQRIIKLADGVEDDDAVTMKQLSDGIGNIDTLVERAEDAADESEAARDEALGYAQDAEDSADAALISETNAKESEIKVLLQFKGEWENDYPLGTGTGYSIADVALFDNNLWYSLADNNTDIPDVGSELPVATWRLYLPGSADSEELVAKVYRATFNGDGVTTDFDLTLNNALFKPTSDNQIMYVSVNQTEVIDFTIYIDGVTGHSFIRFTTPPAVNEDPDGLFNVIVIGATPKLITLEGLPDDPVDGHYLRYNESEGRYEDVSPAEVGDDLRDEINGVITDDVQTTPNYNTFTWQGRISSEAGTIIESATDLVVQGSWSYGSPTLDKANKRIEQLSNSESLGVMLNGEIDNPISFADMDDFDYWFDYEFTGDPATQDYLLGSLGKAPDTDTFGLLLRIYSGQLVFWGSSDGATWDIANIQLGTKTDFTTGRYQFRIVKDSTAGTYEIFWSNDGKLKTDPTKTWTSDIVVNNSANIAYVPSATAGMIGFGGDAFDYEFAGRTPPEYTYYENCGFEDTTGGGNVDIATSAMAAGFIFVPNTEYHQFVGYSGTELVSELCYNADGSDLDVIDGDKALVFSGKTFDNALSYTFMKYYDQYNERFYLTHPFPIIHESSSTVAATFLASHLRPANCEKIFTEYWSRGGYINVLVTSDHTPDFDKSVALYRNVTDSGADTLGNNWIPNIHKSDQLIINRDSYDSNISYLYSNGHSLKRGVKL